MLTFNEDDPDDLSALVDGFSRLEAAVEADPMDAVELTLAQMAWVKMRGPRLLWRGANQIGKAQPMNANILTPSGWVTMNALRIGSEVISSDGTPTTVVDVIPQGVMPTYRVTFDDGSSTECTEQHVWTVQTPTSRFSRDPVKREAWVDMELGEILRAWGPNPKPTHRVSIPTIGAYDGNAGPLPIAPYLLGVMIGDGGMTADSVTITNPDAEIMDRVRTLLPEGVTAREGGKINWRLAVDLGRRNPLISALRSLDLMGKGSHEKHIPHVYAYASYADRLELLRGLMDTDGDIGSQGCATYSTTSRVLADGVRDLIRSLGGKADIADRQTYFTYKGERKAGRPSYRVSVRLPGVDVFHLKRKTERRRDPATTNNRVLVSIEPTGAAECQCITVAHPSGTYVADDYIVTHNSFGLAYKLLCYILRRGPYANRKIGPVRALVLSTSKEQMIPLMEKLWGMLPKGEVCRSARKKNGRSVIEPLEFIDGFGFAGKVPRIYFHSGSGVGSLVQFATYKQGAGRIAGGTFDIVLLDEPPPEKVWGEVMPRVMSKGGDVWVGFTPTPDSPDLKYMRKLVKIEGEKQGQGVKELHTPLTVEAMTLPATNYRPLRYLKTQAQIDAYAASIIPAEADMRVRGGWDIVVTERWFMGWGPSCLMPANEAPPPEAILCISGDHGTKPGRQAFAFLAIAEPQSLCPRVWLLNCYQPTTANDSEQDAEGILTMLAETGKRYGIHIGYDHIQHWIADRATAYNEQGVRKSNSRLKRYLAQKLRRDESALKEIHTPIKHDRSVSDGQTMLNNIMGARQPDGRSNFRAWEGAEAFINSVQTYQGGKNEPAKDMMDAVRYGVEHVCRSQGRTGSVIYS